MSAKALTQKDAMGKMSTGDVALNCVHTCLVSFTMYTCLQAYLLEVITVEHLKGSLY